jgi:hypothetical protein
MTNLVDHARRELELIGQFAEDPAYAQSIVAAVAAVTSYGHSGGSASVAINQLTKLLNHEALGPITDDPAEWCDQSGASGYPLWQNVRDPRMMSLDGGKTYFNVDDAEKILHSNPSKRRSGDPKPAPDTSWIKATEPGVSTGPATTVTEDTLVRVHRALSRLGIGGAAIDGIIGAVLNEGVLFRELVNQEAGNE